jgi:hypothetical protein
MTKLKIIYISPSGKNVGPWWRNLKTIELLDYLGIDGRTILK